MCQPPTQYTLTAAVLCGPGAVFSQTLTLTQFSMYCRLIYKCYMCDTVFTLQSLLYSHFEQHAISQNVSVFKCPDCSMYYAQKQLMLDHIKVSVK